MDLKYLTIGIKDSDSKQIESALLELGTLNRIEEIRKIFKLEIAIEDNRDEFAYASQFLEKHNLEDENPFFNDFKIAAYGLKIDFNVLPSFKYLDILEPIVFVLGQRISSILKRDCIVMFENMRIPVGLFSSGVLIETFENYNREFFKNKAWHPQQNK